MSAADIRVAVLHGPNINTLGRRPAEHYGTITLPDLEMLIRGWAAERSIRVGCFQSNDEGAFLSHLHGLAGLVDAAIVNPGAWTHYQWSIRDALEILGAPFVEVHLSDVESREAHRKISVVRGIASKAIWGKGPDGYRDALDAIPGLLR
jgi:3-dehydroquinate dehydratase-2